MFYKCSKFVFNLRCRYINIWVNNYIDPSVHFTGRKHVYIGKRTVVSERTWFNINKRNDGNSIVIGNNCFIGKNNFFTCGKSIILKDYVMTSVNCSFLGANHNYSDPLIPYLNAEIECDKTIEVGINVMIGAGVTILSGTQIGHGSIIGAGALIDENIPPFSLVVGNPGRVIKRFSFKMKKWVKDLDPGDMCIGELEYIDLLDTNNGVYPYMAAGKWFGNLEE